MLIDKVPMTVGVDIPLHFDSFGPLEYRHCDLAYMAYLVFDKDGPLAIDKDAVRQTGDDYVFEPE